MVSYPPKDVMAIMPKNARLRPIVGGNEAYVKNGTLARSVRQLKLTYNEVKIIKNQGRFLMLEDEDETRKWLMQNVQFLLMKNK